MKILHILHCGALGGMEKFCFELCNQLAENHDVYLMTNVIFKNKISPKVNFVELDHGLKKNNIFHLYRFYKLIMQIQPDIIHVHKQKSIYIAKRLYPFLKIPYVATKHDSAKKRAFNKIPHVISVSENVKQTFVAPNVYKIYTAIKPEIVKEKSKNQIFTIVAVGRLDRVKGFDNLIISCSKLSFEFKLLIVGEGPERAKLEDLIRKNSLEKNVELLGFRDDIPNILAKSHLQIISSLSEGFSLAMIEAIFYSDVLISTPVSGCVEILPDELLVDNSQITEKITDIYNNYNTYKEIFTCIKKKYQNIFDIRNCALAHEEVYEKIIQSV